MKWTRFFAAILPELIALGRVLFESSKGNAEVARGALKTIRDHGADLDKVRAHVDRELAALKAAGK